VEEWAPKLLSVSLKPWQRELIQRVLISQPFARKRDDTLILLFVHLLEKSFPDEPADRKLECLTEYVKGQKTPEPKHTARPEQTPDAGQTQADNKKVDIKFTPVAVMLGRIKDSLAEYFASHDGRHEAWHLEIEDVSKRVKFVRQYSREFWGPHLPNPKNQWKASDIGIVYPEPRFFKSPLTDYFIRHRFINDDTPETDKDATATHAGIPLSGMEESRHYVGAGDARCMLALTTWFERRNGHTTHLVAHANDTWEHLKHKSLLLIGNSRTNWAVRHIQSKKVPLDIAFAIDNSSIKNPVDVASPLNDEHRDMQEEGRLAYACFVRRVHPTTRQVLSCILVNQGPLNELVAKYLTDEERLRELIEDELGLQDEEALPAEFEIVFGGQMYASDHPIDGSFKPIGHRIKRGTPVLRPYKEDEEAAGSEKPTSTPPQNS
jgi:hypothetical protein